MGASEDMILFLDRPIQIVRKYRARRLTLSIRADRPLRLTSNLTTTQEEMLSFLRAHTPWIQKHLAQLKDLKQKFQAPKLVEGALFPYLGELKYFIFVKTSQAKIALNVEDGFLICYQPESKKHENLEEHLQKFYKNEGQKYLKERLKYWSEITKLWPVQIKFGRATTRWGSCNSKKQINLNWKLICHAKHLIDYVIVHELCHLVHLNHSAAFWGLLSEFMPEYLVYEKTLNDETQLSAFLNAKVHAS